MRSDTLLPTPARLTCARADWLTPERVLAPVRAYCGGPIGLDPATAWSNPTGALAYLSGPAGSGSGTDGLRASWSDLVSERASRVVFLNPPYGKDLKLWCAKLHAEADAGVEILSLLPCGARFSTRYWQEHIFTGALDAVCFVRGRVSFIDTTTGKPTRGNIYDSALYGYNVRRARFTQAFSTLGKCLMTVVAN